MAPCPNCGHAPLTGPFCPACGQHAERGTPRRMHAYAAHPGQHVLAPHLISTLFPHLNRESGRHFAVAATVVAVLLAALGLLRLTGPSVVLAAAAIPVLFLVYLWETALWGERPGALFVGVAGVSAILGAVWGRYTGPIVSQQHLLTIFPHAVSTGDSLKTGVLIPLGKQALMLGAPLVLLFWERRSPLLGYAVGAVSALGFILGATLIDLLPQVQEGLVGVGMPAQYALQEVNRGLIVPVIDALTTGLVAGAFWLRRERAIPGGWLAGSAPAVVMAGLVQVALGLVAIYVPSALVMTVLDLMVAVVLIVWARVAIHHMLLIGAPSAGEHVGEVCGQCRTATRGEAFCQTCGTAHHATPRRGAAGRRRAPAWTLAGGVLVTVAVALGTAAVLLAPHQVRCETFRCTAPPVHQRVAGASLPPGTAGYTSSQYGFSVLYPAGDAPNTKNGSSAEWDGQLHDGSMVAWTFFGVNPGGESAKQIVSTTLQNQYPDASYVYTIPGADLGYTAGYGNVYDVQVSPNGGGTVHARLLIIAAVKNGVGVVYMGLGSYKRSTPQTDGHPNPADTELVNLGDMEEMLATVTWPGSTPF